MATKPNAEKKVVLTTLLIIAIILFQQVLVLAVSPDIREGSFNGISIYQDEAIPINVTVRITSGNGSITIKGVKYNLLFKESLIEALYAAAITMGLNPWSFNYEVYIVPADPKASYLSGPSLSLSVYISALAALRGEEVSNTTIATGTINPDLTIGFVGKVKKKAIGTQEFNYTKFIYPLLQHYRYEVRDVAKHIGPYAFMTTMVQVEPENFTDVNITLMQVGWAPQAYAYALEDETEEKPFTQIPDTTLEALAAEAWDYISDKSKVQTVLDGLEREILGYIIRANETLKGDSWILKYPSARSYAYSVLSEATRMLGYYKTLRDKGLLFAAIEYLVYSYEYAVRAYYFLRFLEDNTASVKEAQVLLLSKSRLAWALLKAKANSTEMNAYEISTLAEAASIYLEATKYRNIVNLDLALLSNSMFDQRLIAYSASRNLARVTSSYVKIIILANLAEASPKGPSVNVTRLAQETYAYASHLYRYMRELSIYTRIESELVSLAGSNWWLAKNYLKQNTNDTINYLAVIGYSLKSIAYSSLYMVLHPGFEGIADARYPYALKTLYMLTDKTGYDPMTAYVLQLGLLYSDPANRLYLIERAISYSKMLLFANATSSQSGTVHIFKSPYEEYNTQNNSNNSAPNTTGSNTLLQHLANLLGIGSAFRIVILITIAIVISAFIGYVILVFNRKSLSK